MECSIKEEKIQAMKNYKRAQFLYNFILYSLTSLITCLVFSYPFWFLSMKHFISSLPNGISLFFNPKCFFIMGNLIVFILIGESKLTQSSHPSPNPDIYDEYVARIQSTYPKASFNKEKEKEQSMQSLTIDEKKHGNEENMISHEEKKKEMRVCQNKNHGEKKIKGMRVSKSEIWGESEILRREKTKGEKEEEESMQSLSIEEKKHGNEENISHEEKKIKGMRVCKNIHHGEKKILGMRVSKSEIWGESEILEREKTKGEKEEQLCIPGEEFNKRVEAFIARVNKRRLLEAKLED